MKKDGIIYIGNQLSQKGKTPTGVEFLGEQLKQFYPVFQASDKLNPFLRLFHMVFTFLKFKKESKFLLIDTYSGKGFYFVLILALLANVFRIPYITILHGGNLPERLKKNPFLSRLIFCNAWKNIAPSMYLVEAFRASGYKTIAIPNFIDLSKYPFIKKTSFSPKLLWVRSFHSIYNPTLAIQVIKELHKKYPNVSLCMVGPDKDGSLEKCQLLAKELNLVSNISFPGFISKKELVCLSKEFDIFINTTNFDNTPISILEAMAFGLPVISTNVGGLPFLIENGKDGFLVPPSDKDAFIEKILLIMNSPEIGRNLAEHARKKVANFDIVPVINQWRNVLK